MDPTVKEGRLQGGKGKQGIKAYLGEVDHASHRSLLQLMQDIVRTQKREIKLRLRSAMQSHSTLCFEH